MVVVRNDGKEKDKPKQESKKNNYKSKPSQVRPPYNSSMESTPFLSQSKALEKKKEEKGSGKRVRVREKEIEKNRKASQVIIPRVVMRPLVLEGYSINDNKTNKIYLHQQIHKYVYKPIQHHPFYLLTWQDNH